MKIATAAEKRGHSKLRTLLAMLTRYNAGSEARASSHVASRALLGTLMRKLKRKTK
jgi:hypothetical protein